MKRIAMVLAIVATLAFAGPASANHEIWKADLHQPGMHGTITVELNWTHTEGTLSYALDGMHNGDASIDVNAGACGDNLGNIVLRWVTGKTFVNGEWVGSVNLPTGSAFYFKDGVRDHDMVSVTVRNEGAYECQLFERTHP